MQSNKSGFRFGSYVATKLVTVFAVFLSASCLGNGNANTPGSNLYVVKDASQAIERAIQLLDARPGIQQKLDRQSIKGTAELFSEPVNRWFVLSPEAWLEMRSALAGRTYWAVALEVQDAKGVVSWTSNVFVDAKTGDEIYWLRRR